MDEQSETHPEAAAAESEATQSTDASDRFDIVGQEVASMLRGIQEASERSQAEAEEQAAAIRARAEAEAAALAERVAEAEKDAESAREQAHQELEEAERARAEAAESAEQAARSRADALDGLAAVLGLLDQAEAGVTRMEAQAADVRAELAEARRAVVSLRESNQDTPTPPDQQPTVTSEPSRRPRVRRTKHADREPERGTNGTASQPDTAQRPRVAAPGVTDAVRSAVQRAVAERRRMGERQGD